MPRELFFNIDQTKRERIYQAALLEFSKNAFNEASINKIVNQARISRGSFYQYFDDKRDLYFYLLDTILEEESYAYINDLIDKDDDIFEFFRKVFVFNLKLVSDSRYSNFFEKLYVSLNYDITCHLNEINTKYTEKLIKKKSKKFMSDTGRDEEYIRELINILQLINRNLIAKKVIEKVSYEQTIHNYDMRIMILKSEN